MQALCRTHDGGQRQSCRGWLGEDAAEFSDELTLRNASGTQLK